MKKIFIFILVLVVIGGLFSINYFYYHKDFPLHLTFEESQRKEETSLPSAEIMDIMSIGNRNTYADFLWISMIQYIGDNVANGNFSQYSLSLIERITELSPKFATPYEWALWLMPIPQTAGLSYSDEQKNNLNKPLSIAHKGISETCNAEKLDIIQKTSLHSIKGLLEKNPNLKNACKSGMLPYLVAFYGGQLMEDYSVAENFYKIASTHDDAPSVSQVLAIIAGKPKDNPKNISENFAIMAVGGYDEEPFMCIESANTLIQILQKNHISPNDIKNIENIEKNLPKMDDSKGIGQQKCSDFFERAVKYFYLAFVHQESEKNPNIDTIEDLLATVGIAEIPTTKSQENMSIYKKGNIWEYGPKKSSTN